MWFQRVLFLRIGLFFLIHLMFVVQGLYAASLAVDARVAEGGAGRTTALPVLARSELPTESESILGRSVLDLFAAYLATPEFIFEKRMYMQQASSFYGTALKFEYPAAIIPGEQLEILFDRCIESYKSVGLPAEAHVYKHIMPVDADVRFFGDLHGSVHAFIRMLSQLMAQGFIDAHLRIINPLGHMVFLGDFVDYGRNGADTLALVMMLRLANPGRVLICRGNHEDREIYSQPNYGFAQELEARYPSTSYGLKRKVDSFFTHLPLAIFLGIDGHAEAGFVQCCHGGFANDRPSWGRKSTMQHIQDLLAASEKVYQPVQATTGGSFLSDLQWGDFTGREIPGGVQPGHGRGAKFSISGSKAYLAAFGGVGGPKIHYAFRGHQDSSYSCKCLLPGFDGPMSLHPLESNNQATIAGNAEIAAWRDAHANSTNAMYADGFLLGDIHEQMGPVFTFTNATAARANYEEGFGALLVGDSWQKSRLRMYVSRPDIFTIHAAAFDAVNARGVLPEPIEKAWPVGEPSTSTIVPVLLLPHYTRINADGSASVYIHEPDGLSDIRARTIAASVSRECIAATLEYYRAAAEWTPGIDPGFARVATVTTPSVDEGMSSSRDSLTPSSQEMGSEGEVDTSPRYDGFVGETLLREPLPQAITVGAE